MGSIDAVHLDSVVTAVEDQASSDLGEETVVLSLEAGVYYGLNAVASRAWDLLQQPRSVREIVEVIVAEYDVTRQECQRDVLRFLESLVEHRLARVER